MTIYTLEDVSPNLPQEGHYWVAPTASVIGQVTLCEAASVWFGAVLRGDNEEIQIGERTNIQDGCVLHTDMGAPLRVGNDCTVGHLAMLHGCSIGNNTLIGMGATVLNHAKVGDNCLIGAHTLIPEGKVIPDNSLVVGSPGKIIRVLDAEAIARISEASAIYVSKWKRYAAGFKTA